MAKKNKAELDTTERFVETLVVGAGPAGITAARRLQKSHPEMQILVLEAGDRSGGRAQSGLHLVDANLANSYAILMGESLEPAKIRWEKSWVSSTEVKWEGQDWVADLPQWKLYLEGTKKLFLGLQDSDVEVAVKALSPVSQIARLTYGTEFNWKLETSAHTYHCKRVVWAAGLTAFQNAYGKHEAQEFFEANPSFNPKAQDFRGGVAVDLNFSEAPSFTEEIPTNCVLAIPVKHSGKRYLILAAWANTKQLRTLTHVHLDLLSDPKEIASFQKSIRRGIHALIKDFDEGKCSESWVVSNRVGGHCIGSPWVFALGIPSSLEFVGEESIEAVKNGASDLLGALQSANAISMGANKLETVEVVQELREQIISEELQ